MTRTKESRKVDLTLYQLGGSNQIDGVLLSYNDHLVTPSPITWSHDIKGLI